MRSYRRIRALAFAGVGVVAIVLLSAGLSGLALLPAEPFAFSSGAGQPAAGPLRLSAALLGSVLRVLSAICLWVLLPISLIYVIVSPEARRRVLRSLLSLTLMAAALLVVLPRLERFALDAIEADAGLLPPAGVEELLTPADVIVNPPPWLVFAVGVVLLALLFGLGWFVWRRFLRPDEPLALLAKEAQVALDDLRAGSQLHDAVLRCYWAMSEVLSKNLGYKRTAGMTTREFEQELVAVGVRDEHIGRLTRLFEAVRYGAKTPSQTQEREAQACLEAIIHAYGKLP